MIKKTEQILPNSKCPCKSGRKFKKCCYGLLLETADYVKLDRSPPMAAGGRHKKNLKMCVDYVKRGIFEDLKQSIKEAGQIRRSMDDLQNREGSEEGLQRTSETDEATRLGN